MGIVGLRVKSIVANIRSVTESYRGVGEPIERVSTLAEVAEDGWEEAQGREEDEKDAEQACCEVD